MAYNGTVISLYHRLNKGGIPQRMATIQLERDEDIVAYAQSLSIPDDAEQFQLGEKVTIYVEKR